MKLSDLLKTFSQEEQAQAQEAIDDRSLNLPSHKPSGYYGLPLEKAWKLDEVLNSTPKQQEQKP